MKTKKSLTREQRQVRYIPLFITILVALIYGIIHINTGGQFFQEALPGWWTFHWEVSRYFDIPMIYLASLIFIMLCQKDGGVELFETVFINIALVLIAGFISWVSPLTLLTTVIIVLGVFWGLAYPSAKEIGVNMLILFTVLTFIFGFINAFIVSFVVLLLAGMAISFRLFTRGADFRKFLFWIGLSPKEEYEVNNFKPSKEEYKVNNPKPSVEGTKKSAIIVDLSVAPEEVEGFTVKSHKPGPKEFVFDPDNLALYLSFIQKEQNGAQGTQIIKDPIIEEKSFNCALLDWLLKYPENIPAEWKEIQIPFWDTRYERNGIEHVRYLVWIDNKFVSSICWLTRNFDDKFKTLIAK